jgi:2-polyprenyl-3-methyl-5-hydroxy-6-metoxy-1,4-benzoquinol methylase
VPELLYYTNTNSPICKEHQLSMSKWSEIYKKQMLGSASLETFINEKLSYKKPLVDTIERYIRDDKKILEIGCGSGITTTFLGQLGFRVMGIDSDQDMLEIARHIATQQKSPAIFIVEDISTLKTIHDHFGVIFSNGVMEHFSDENIVAIVNLHLSLSDYVIISIPSDHFSNNQKIYGDERFMDKNKWQSILSKTKGSIVEEFSFNFDKAQTDKPQFIGFVLSSL